ncbi:MAG: Rieske (2Fe-2S) protein [Chloroflexi bacterium]|nr:Rieske (2Fe-2S) protein [Chloroflexota bacterium]
MATVSAVGRTEGWQRAARITDFAASGHVTVEVDGHVVLLWRDGERVFALDNRCPHMGFPLDRGTCADGLLTCHWHQARFDLESGGTFDSWADDVPTFPVEVRSDEVWVNTAARRDPAAYHQERLQHGLEHNLRLVLAKSAIGLTATGGDVSAALAIALDYGVNNRGQGWGSGLTMLACFARLIPYADPEDRPWALFHALDAVSRDTAGSSRRFQLEPLPGGAPPFPTLKRWFRQFISVRDTEAAERTIATAVKAGCSRTELAEMLFAACSDYRYLDGGHALDFTNRAFDALDATGWLPHLIAPVLTSIVPVIADGGRREENSSWRHPIDLIALFNRADGRLPEVLAKGVQRAGSWAETKELAHTLLRDDPQVALEALLAALAAGATPEQLAAAVAYAAAKRIAQFHLSNEFGDWDTVHHTFTYVNAVHMALRRLSSRDEAVQRELLRAVLDGALAVYLDRYLNVPAARTPVAAGAGDVDRLLRLLDRRQQVNEAAQVVVTYSAAGGSGDRLQAVLSKALLREDRDFHAIQNLEAALTQFRLQGDPLFAIAAVRYLAAHASTPRAQAQTYRTALRLHRGDRLFDEEEVREPASVSQAGRSGGADGLSP